MLTIVGLRPRITPSTHLNKLTHSIPKISTFAIKSRRYAMILNGGLIAMLGFVAFTTEAKAVDGYIEAGFDPIQKSLAGAGVANSENAMSLAINPAGLVDVGQQLNASTTFLMPKAEYSGYGTGFIAPGSNTSSKKFYALPAGAYSQPIDGESSFGIAVYPNGGSGTSYNVWNPNTHSWGVFGGGVTGAEFLQALISAGYAHRFGNISIGVAPLLSLQRFDAWGLAPLAGSSVAPFNVSNKGYAWAVGVGLRVGLEWHMTPGLRFAVAGTTPVTSSEFQSYHGLLADRGKLDTPATITAGFAWDALPVLTLLLDYKHIFYSDVNALGDSSQIPPLLGSVGGAGFGWHDVDVFSVGGEWRVAPSVILRAGYAHNTNPIPASAIVLNILAPLVMTDHITTGVSYLLTEHSSIDASAVYVPRHPFSGEVSPAMGGGAVKLSSSGFEASLGWTYKFDTGPGPLVAKY